MAQAARLNLRMQKELKILTTDPPPGVSLNFSDKDDLSLTSFEAKIEGPEGTVYSKGIFTLKIQIPERYPFQPPNVTFLTPIYHPNIDNGGRICLDILNLPPKGAWQPSLNISTVLTSIGLLLSEPNPDDGLMAEASREYKYNKQVFDQKALSWTELYAYPGAKGRKEETGPNLVKEPIKEAETIEGLIENSEHFEGRKRKMRLLGHKLSLNSSWLEQKGNNENNKENLITEIKPNKEIFNQEVSEKLKDLSSLEKKGNNENNKEYSIPETKSKVKINHEGSKKLKDVSNLEKKGNNENKKENLIAETKSKVKFNHDGSKKLRDLSNLDLDTIIVSDSEESEEDEKTKRPFRARMKISGKRKC